MGARVRDRPAIQRAGDDKAWHGFYGWSVLLNQDVDRAFLPFQAGDDGVVFAVAIHLKVMDNPHRRVNQRVGRNGKALIIQPDLARTGGKKPAFVTIMVMGFNPRPDTLIGKVANDGKARPIGINILFPIMVVRVL